MKNLIPALALSAFVVAAGTSPAVFAHGNADGHAGQGGMTDQKMMDGKMGGGQMMPMHEHMQKMQAMMTKIHAESDPAKHQQLMQEHMQAMQQGMQMMKDSMGGDQNQNMAGIDMQQCMQVMGQQMDMMQKMMGQMSQHQAEADTEKDHGHNK